MIVQLIIAGIVVGFFAYNLHLGDGGIDVNETWENFKDFADKMSQTYQIWGK